MNDRKLQEIMERIYPVFTGVEKTASGKELFTAGLFDVPGCVAQGSSGPEAYQRLEAIKPAYFSKLLELGVDIPDPTPFPAVVPGLMRFYDEETGGMVTGGKATLEGTFDVQDLEFERVS